MLFGWLLFEALACGPPCKLQCPDGYVCSGGQCEIDENGGRERAIRCGYYCRKLSDCGRGDAAKCEANSCPDFAKLNETEREFRTRFFECHLASSCEEIKQHREAKAGFLADCAGCLTDLDCPGSFRCNVETRVCLKTCKDSLDCWADHVCDVTLKICKSR